jgi:hypothetical protein
MAGIRLVWKLYSGCGRGLLMATAYPDRAADSAEKNAGGYHSQHKENLRCGACTGREPKHDLDFGTPCCA